MEQEKDIVERLRDIYPIYYTRDERRMIDDIRMEAADEIERLREKVENLELAATAYKVLGQERGISILHPDTPKGKTIAELELEEIEKQR